VQELLPTLGIASAPVAAIAGTAVGSVLSSRAARRAREHELRAETMHRVEWAADRVSQGGDARIIGIAALGALESSERLADEDRAVTMAIYEAVARLGSDTEASDE